MVTENGDPAEQFAAEEDAAAEVEEKHLLQNVSARGIFLTFDKFIIK